ncbi:unnamed protein product [Microthlaspi erraticum]|uniref:Glutamate-1-semialdehyde 2,1-aminomutase n=1 Tax=Microthlaspi erraticum TaxID=1685480 RepID=A0A6D2KVH8_9BRAS|nr:unnamed protein product [Microthlaspi erraticum]
MSAREIATMAATLTGSRIALGFSCSAKISQRAPSPSSSSSSRCCIKMSVSGRREEEEFHSSAIRGSFQYCQALGETMKKGTSFGAPCLLENVLAETVISAVPSIEMVRFVNSGTEACMGVLRLARAFTGKQKFIKFEGCYHGHDNSFLVKAAPHNDLAAVEKLFEANRGEMAAIIVEPVVGNSGFITPKPEFLDGIRRISIFDEVMTGCGLAYGGAQEYFGITPDLATLGKNIGGGHIKRLRIISRYMMHLQVDFSEDTSQVQGGVAHVLNKRRRTSRTGCSLIELFPSNIPMWHELPVGLQITSKALTN